MPLPEPKTKESNADFLGRCMGDDVMVEEYPDQKQRAAVCRSQYAKDDDPEPLEKFTAFTLSESTGSVDYQAGTIKDISILTVGEAKGHRMMISQKTLESSITLLLGKTLPAYLSHDGATGDRLLTEAGYFSRFYRDGDQIRAGKFTALDSFKKYDREKFDRLFEIAEVAPETFGVSIVFEGHLFWEMSDGTEESMEMGMEQPENARFEYPTVRPLKITSADFVDTPAANGALFSEMGDKSTKGIDMNLTTTETKPPAEPVTEEVFEELGASNESASAAHEAAAQEGEKKAAAPEKKKTKAKTKKALAEEDEEDREDEERGEDDEIAEEEEGETVEEEEESKEPEADELEEPDDEYQERMRAAVEEVYSHIENAINRLREVMDMTGVPDKREEGAATPEEKEMAELKARVDELTKLHTGTSPIKDSATGEQPKTKQEIISAMIEKYLSTHPNSCRSAAVIEVSKTNPELWDMAQKNN